MSRMSEWHAEVNGIGPLNTARGQATLLTAVPKSAILTTESNMKPKRKSEFISVSLSKTSRANLIAEGKRVTGLSGVSANTAVEALLVENARLRQKIASLIETSPQATGP